MNKLLTVVGLSVICLVYACSGGDGTDAGETTACQPGTYADCSCTGGAFGTRTCGPDGAWGSCKNCQDGKDTGEGVDTGGRDTGNDDAGGEDDTGTDGGPTDTGTDAGPTDTGTDVGPTDTGTDGGPDDAGPVDGGTDTGPGDIGTADGGIDTGPDDSGADAGIQDAGKVYSVSGKLTLNDQPGNVPNQSIDILISRTPPEAGDPPVTNVSPDGSGTYTFPWIEPGAYYVYAKFNAQGSKPATFTGVYDKNPITVLSDLTGIDFNLYSVSVRVGSVLVKNGSKMLGGSTVSGPLLLNLAVQVYDPATQDPIADATVKANDGTSTLSLTYSAKEQKYLYTWGPSADGPYTAVEGTYTFTVKHTAFASTLSIPLKHHPLTLRPAITTPSANAHYVSVQAVTVDWTEVPGSNPMRGMVFDTAVNALPIWTMDLGGLPSNKPFTVPAATFSAGKGYELGVITGREISVPAVNGQSGEQSQDDVLVTF